MPPQNLFTHPPAPTLIAASILSADFAEMGADSRAALDAGADLLHLDVMDGHFVPNLSMGPALCRSLRQALPDAFLDVHLMVTDPARFVDAFIAAGANHLSFHIEAVPQPVALARRIRQAGLTAGLALNPDTGHQAVAPFLEAFDLVLVMSVHPGFSGQTFIPAVMEKARRIKPKLGVAQRLEVDGGVNVATATSCRDAGCDVLVAASAIFGARSYPDAISGLRGPARVLRST